MSLPRKTVWKQGWREIGGKKIYARSAWEANYARYLQTLKDKGEIKDWLHEPVTFWFEKVKRGCRSYLPDFQITHLNGDIEYREVKGYFDAASRTKIRRMIKYHPTVRLDVVDTLAYKKLERNFSRSIPNWE